MSNSKKIVRFCAMVIKYIEKILSVPKSLYASWRFCPDVSPWRLPLFVRFNTCLRGNGLIIVNKPKTGGKKSRLMVGFGNVGLYIKRFSPAVLEINGKVMVDGRANFGQGAKLCVGKGATLHIGDNVVNTAEARIVCFCKMNIGENALLGWEATIMDTDFHHTENVNTGELSIEKKEVTVGKGVWIGQRATVLKGCRIANNCIVGACAVVTKSFTQENTFLAGNPAVVKKIDIKIHR